MSPSTVVEHLKSGDNNETTELAATSNVTGYRVMARIRPLLARELSAGPAVQVTGPARLLVQEPFKEPAELHVEGILGQEVGQADVFESVADVVEAVTRGCSGTILAYGQTGSGKTHMMIGSPSTSGTFNAEAESQRGLVPRALERLFALLAQQPGGSKVSRVRVSVMEIYNETVFDLSEPAAARKSLELRDSGDGAVAVQGLAFVEVHCLEDALRLLERSMASRARADNGINANSSRSHAIFQVSVEDQSRLRAARLTFVDLAGSERVLSYGPKLAETSHINRSLSTLAHCIAALRDTKRKHVPYRSSKLTRLLQEALQSPLSTTVMCVCISPGHASISETMRTLQFADCARRVAIQRPVQPTKDLNSMSSEIDRVTEELRIERMERARLEALLRSTTDSQRPEGLDLMQAFQKTKEGLKQIICTVDCFEHTAPALATAKQGLLELAGAIDVLRQDAIAANSAGSKFPALRCAADKSTPRGTMCAEVLELADWLQAERSDATSCVDGQRVSPGELSGVFGDTLITV
jgi:hypothetical protein